MKPKHYKLRQGFPKTKQNVQIIKKNFGNGTKLKLLVKKFGELIENVCFDLEF